MNAVYFEEEICGTEQQGLRGEGMTGLSGKNIITLIYHYQDSKYLTSNLLHEWIINVALKLCLVMVQIGCSLNVLGISEAIDINRGLHSRRETDKYLQKELQSFLMRMKFCWLELNWVEMDPIRTANLDVANKIRTKNFDFDGVL